MKATILELPFPKQQAQKEEEEEDEGSGGGGIRGERVEKGKSSHLELRLGISPSNGLDGADPPRGGGNGVTGPKSPRFLTAQDGVVGLQAQISGHGAAGTKRSFAEASGGFVHPWSLAARQEKAALEQAKNQHNKPTSSSISRSANIPPPSPVVGWPPVGSFRRNLGFSQTSPSSKSAVLLDSQQQTKRSTTVQEEMKREEEEEEEEETILYTSDDLRNNNLMKIDAAAAASPPPAMFVKVNIEGYAVGRKIDLKAHDGYDSLSRALQKMFHNFFNANYLSNPKEDERDEVRSLNYILLYEDNEGDRMLVGDVPWKMFMNSVKRLYITLDSRPYKCG